MRKELVALTKGVEAALRPKERRHPSGSQMVDRQERVLAVLVRDGEGVPVNVFALERQRLEVGEHMPANDSEFFYVVGANIKIGGFLVLRECVETHRKEHHLARAA